MTYEIGYRRPPKATRWKKGQSGNPRGRSAGIRDLATELAEEMAEVVQITEQGTPRKVSKQRALIKALTARAVQGDARAASTLVGLLTKLPMHKAAQEQEPAALSAEDVALLDAFIKRHTEVQP